MKHSKEDLTYFDTETNTKFIPWIVETSGGADRFFLFSLLDAYTETEETDEEGNKKTRVVLKLHNSIAPIKVGLLPIVKKEEFINKTDEIFAMLAPYWNIDIDLTGSIGKRYARQDEIGTPFCITIDNATLENGTVTIRHRDTGLQDVVKISDLVSWIRDRVEA